MDHPSATKCSTCHIYPPYCSEKERIVLHGRRKGQKTTDHTDPTSTIAFGSSPQTLLSKCTMRTVRLGGNVDGPLRKNVFTRALRSARDLLLLDSVASRLLVRERPKPRNVLLPVQTRSPAAMGHTLAVDFPQARKWEELLSREPTPSHAMCLLASAVQAQVAGSIPHSHAICQSSCPHSV